MKLPLCPTIVSLLSFFTVATNAFASFSIENLHSAFVIDFTGFNGSGFSPEPEPGQLDSDMWAIDRLSDGSLDFGGTAISGDSTSNDFARGSDPDAVGTGGIYAFDVGDGNTTLGIQPNGSDWTPGSFTLKIQNNTGQTLTSLDFSYSIYVYNDEDRASSFNFSHSIDNNTYTGVGILDFSSPAAADDPVDWVETSLDTTITGLSVADGSDYYLRWSGNDLSGSGSRDQFALDNVSITAVPEPAYFGLICGLIMLFVIIKRARSLKT